MGRGTHLSMTTAGVLGSHGGAVGWKRGVIERLKGESLYHRSSMTQDEPGCPSRS